MPCPFVGEKLLEEEGEEGGIVVSGDEHAAAMDRPLVQLTVDALLPDGGIRSIITQIKKKGKPRKSSTVALGEGAGTCSFISFFRKKKI